MLIIFVSCTLDGLRPFFGTWIRPALFSDFYFLQYRNLGSLSPHRNPNSGFCCFRLGILRFRMHQLMCTIPPGYTQILAQLPFFWNSGNSVDLIDIISLEPFQPEPTSIVFESSSINSCSKSPVPQLAFRLRQLQILAGHALSILPCLPYTKYQLRNSFPFKFSPGSQIMMLSLLSAFEY